MTEPLVANAADSKQVRHARRKEAGRVERERNQMRAVLDTVDGRAVLWRLLQRLGYGQTLASMDPARIPVAAGQQDAMWQVLAMVVEADEESLIRMMREARAAEKRDEVEAQALRTPTEGETAE